jgi:16S rRNA processing protein RimM
LSISSTEQQAEEQVLVGKITGAFGIKGWVKVHSFTSPIENIVSYLPWTLKLGPDEWKIDVLDAAEAIAGAEIFVARNMLTDLIAGEYYWRDLIGLDVTDTAGQLLGKVDSILETGANDVLVIEGKKRRLVPYVVGDVIKSVDMDAGIIQIDWVEPE